jgi:large subunit ribosomal protein L10
MWALRRQQVAFAVNPAEDINKGLIVFVPLRLFGCRGFSFWARLINRVEVKTHMPNAKVLSEKQAIVEALAERIRNASAGVLVDYKGITVAEDTELRTEMRKEEVHYTVVKNTLTRKALDKLGLNELDAVLNGTTSLATAEKDPIAPFRILSDYSKKLGERFNIKAAFMDGKVLSESEIAEMAELPSKDALYAKVLGTMIAPITGLAVCLGQILEQKGGSLETPAAEAAE